MVNIQEFTMRLKKVMEHHQLTATLFADKVGVQRSSISHILSGRNKPSLDFILKVTSNFADVDIEWLLNGKGKFPNNINMENTTTPSLFSSNLNNESKFDTGKKVERIVVFYSDGTFGEYKKNS